MSDERRDFIKAAVTVAIASGTGACASSLHERRATLDETPRLNLTNLPTSLNPMPNLSRRLGGPDLFVKRDDVMELAHGGNKTRKLEYTLADASAKGAKAVVTQGGLQSNHVRQTCSAAARIGLEAHVVLSNPVPEMEAQLTGSGNFLMDQLMGAHIYRAGGDRSPVVERVMGELLDREMAPYNIPTGASDGIGSLGYVNAARELMQQWDAMNILPSHVVTASGSYGTQAGLLFGLRYFGNRETQVVGISVSADRQRSRARMRSVLAMISETLGAPPDLVSDADIIIHDEFIGAGYGHPTEAGISAMKTVAENEGIILDPVYTGKAMSGLLVLAMVGDGPLKNGQDIVFLHTGGAPAIHPYAEFLI
ncbi:MAG: D-cysteine desulfhydrase family protein [Pseudomonadota bacterium]